jgi:hypothetical protein
MTGRKLIWALGATAFFALLGSGLTLSLGQEKALPRRDVRKYVVENPTKRLLAGKANQAESQIPADVRKGSVELPVKETIKVSSAVEAGKFVNPKVTPGLVHWHASFDEACAQSRRSGKPVLLFQMMGKLDDQFC